MDKLAELSHGAKVVLGSAIAFLIVSFFNWQEVDTVLGDYGVSMWHGVGYIAGLLAIALIVWQAVRLANINVEIGVTPSMITTVLAILMFVFTLITFISHNEFRTIWSWIGLILSIVIVAGAWWNMKLAGESFGDMKDKVSSMASSATAGSGDGGSAGSGGSGTSGGSAASSTPDAAADAADGDDKPTT